MAKQLYFHATEIVDKLISIPETELDAKHTHDIEGSFRKQEVQLAFRCHGAQLETLSYDTTPVGQHFLLQHYDVPAVTDLSEYRLEVKGYVKNPITFTIDEIRSRKQVSMHITMECAGNGRTLMRPRFNHHLPWHLQAFGNYLWTGTPLRDLLDEVGIDEEHAVDIVFTGMDCGMMDDGKARFYRRALSVNDPVVDHCLLAWGNNGTDLQPQHGKPRKKVIWIYFFVF